jgi:nicotinate-nucleotide--dimethylbenzimidazole phosphoribosyltransferase
MISFASSTAFAATLAAVKGPDMAAMNTARQRQRQLSKPPGSLGRLEDTAIQLAGWSEDGQPRADRVTVVVFAGNHGVTAQGISPYPASVTAQMVANYAGGGAAINSISRTFGLQLSVVPLDLDHPTGDISVGPAMTVQETLDAFNIGAAQVPADCDIFIPGEMGIGNTTIAAAIAARVCGGPGLDWAGAGTGLDAAGIGHKALVVDRALDLHAGSPQTAFDILRTLGGRDVAAMAGAILAARLQRIPVLIDGFVVTAALAALWAEQPRITDHCIAAHVSGERAHRALLQKLELTPLLDLGLRLGEASGAALAVPLLRAAVATHCDMATFGDAGVSERDAAS